jgi:aarF domain-containing kinase
METVEKSARYVERLLTYLVLTAPLAGLVPMNYLLGERFPELENMTYGYLVWAVRSLGPCFIKLAQWASTRPDLFPPKLIERIEKFQDDVQIRLGEGC